MPQISEASFLIIHSYGKYHIEVFELIVLLHGLDGYSLSGTLKGNFNSLTLCNLNAVYEIATVEAYLKVAALVYAVELVVYLTVYRRRGYGEELVVKSNFNVALTATLYFLFCNYICSFKSVEKILSVYLY